MANNKSQCASCGGENKSTSICAGCSQNFCSKHFTEHRQELNRQLDEIEQDRDLFQQTLNQHRTNPQKDLLINQVNRWEHESIEKIQRTAEDIRELLSNHIDENLISRKKKLDQLTQQLRESREEGEIIEGDLQAWKKELKQLTRQPNIIVRQTETSLVKQIQVQFSGKYTYSALT